MFWTVENELKSPENAGMIVRSHVAFGGQEIVIIQRALAVQEARSSLSSAFRGRCAATVTIPQYGPAGSLNAAVSASIAMYELTRWQPMERRIVEGKYVAEAGERRDVCR